MNGFTHTQPFDGVYHIRDAMGVCMTLLAGSERALLVDTGYGIEDAAAYVRALTDRPVRVLLTHAHHDHVLGARWFEETWMLGADMEAFGVYTDGAHRARVAQQAQARGLDVPADYLTTDIPQPQEIVPQTIDLGGLHAQIIACPGHTPGSAVVYVPEHRLLLTADDWNPCTWLFFPEALGAKAYRENVASLLSLPFIWALCSHREAVYPRSAVEAFLGGLTGEALCSAQRVDLGHPADTREAHPAEGQQFVFDFGKAGLE